MNPFRPLRRHLLAFACCVVAGHAQAADYTMRISHQFPPLHQVAKAMESFASDARAATGGRVEVQVFGAEQLYKANQNHAAVARGQVEAAVISNFTWGSTVPEMNLSSIPFLIARADQLRRFPGSEAAKLLDGKLEATGVRNLAWLVDANDALFTSSKAPLIAPADFRGVKIRGFSKLVDHGFAAMGATPVTMPGSEVYQALQSGVIDAGVTGVAAGHSRRYYEVQKYGVACAFQTVYDNLVVNPAWWAKLPADLQAALRQAAAKAEAGLLPNDNSVAAEDVKRLREKGMEVTVLTPAQEKALADVMQPPVIKAFVESTPDGARLVELVRKL
ncbi:TRAP transporter substrate-binding protein DctP [Derxia gummosa]|uniref:TRAP transporter substrate-binding protein DctP n=1 Tax=Derxia gummosa DSM 723 TaxID=1121388 RepID=A0A8B6X4L7_9BURK|nr:TRAP transporter substrate-binding protein DctP [Derxia gummosa]